MSKKVSAPESRKRRRSPEPRQMPPPPMVFNDETSIEELMEIYEVYKPIDEFISQNIENGTRRDVFNFLCTLGQEHIQKILFTGINLFMQTRRITFQSAGKTELMDKITALSAITALCSQNPGEYQSEPGELKTLFEEVKQTRL
jgi:hypothetical protein